MRPKALGTRACHDGAMFRRCACPPRRARATGRHPNRSRRRRRSRRDGGECEAGTLVGPIRKGRVFAPLGRKRRDRSLRSPWGAAQGRVRPGPRPAARLGRCIFSWRARCRLRGGIIDHGVAKLTTQVQLYTSPAYCGPRGVLESTTSTVHGHRVHAVLYDTLLVNAGERLLVAMPAKKSRFIQ